MSLLSDYRLVEQVGITDSVTTTDSTIAASATAVKAVKDAVDLKLNSGDISYVRTFGLTGTYGGLTPNFEDKFYSIAITDGIITGINYKRFVASDFNIESFTYLTGVGNQSSYIGSEVTYGSTDGTISINTVVVPKISAGSAFYEATGTATLSGTWVTRGKTGKSDEDGINYYITQRVA